MSGNQPDKQKQKQMILHEKLWKVVCKVSWPAIIALVLYGLNSVFDAIFVGRYVGETALAGVSIAYPLSQMTLGIGSLIGVGAGSMMSITLGSNDRNIQRKLLSNVNVLAIAIGVFYSVVVWFFAETLVELMGGQGEALRFGTQYLKVTAIGAIFSIYGLSVNMIVRAEGKMKSAAMIMGVGLAVNIFSNYILVGVLNFGVMGAAWGTNIGMLVYTLFGLIYFSQGKASFEARPFMIKCDKKVIKTILSMGASSFFTSVMNLVQAAIVFNVLSGLGTVVDIAFYGVSFRIFTLVKTPVIGMMRALQPIVGINFGAGNSDRVIKSVKAFIISGALLLLPIWILLLLTPQAILSTMISNTTYDLNSLLCFRVFVGLLPILPIPYLAMAFFPAINNGKLAFYFGVMRHLILFVPIMLILPGIFGIRWIYFGSTAVDIVVTMIAIILFIKEFKKLREGKNKSKT